MENCVVQVSILDLKTNRVIKLTEGNFERDDSEDAEYIYERCWLPCIDGQWVELKPEFVEVALPGGAERKHTATVILSVTVGSDYADESTILHFCSILELRMTADLNRKRKKIQKTWQDGSIGQSKAELKRVKG